MLAPGVEDAVLPCQHVASWPEGELDACPLSGRLVREKQTHSALDEFFSF